MYVALQINSQQLQDLFFIFLFAITAVHNFFVILSTDARTRSGTTNVGFGVCHNMNCCLSNVIACCCLSMLTCFFAKEIWKVSTFMVS